MAASAHADVLEHVGASRIILRGPRIGGGSSYWTGACW